MENKKEIMVKITCSGGTQTSVTVDDASRASYVCLCGAEIYISTTCPLSGFKMVNLIVVEDGDEFESHELEFTVYPEGRNTHE